MSNGTNETNGTGNYEYVNHPKHYQKNGVECIDWLISKYGKPAVALWCLITADKYEFRKGSKPNESMEREEAKIKWYTDKGVDLTAEMLRESIGKGENQYD